MILIERADGVHNNARAKIGKRMKLYIYRSKFNIDFLAAFFQFYFGKKTNTVFNRRRNKKREARNLETETFANTIGLKP